MGRNLLLLDFDGTITAHDTLDSLVTLAISATATTTSSTDTATSTLPPNSNSNHPNPNPNQTHNLTSPTPTTNHEPDPDPDESAADETNINKATTTIPSSQQSQTALWQRIVADYAAARAAHVAAYAPPAAARTTLADELAFLEALGPVEAHAVSRVSAAGFFRGLRPAGLRRLGRTAVALAGASGEGEGGKEGGNRKGSGDGKEGEEEGRVRVRKGFARFLGALGAAGGDGREGKWDVAVVSVNWSGEFIRGVIEGTCGGGDGGVRRVVANGVSWPRGEVEGPAELGGQPLSTAGDKLRAMRSLREGLEEQTVVYFGDSTTDLACLAAADFGVVMADDAESKLLKTLKRIGFEVPHVADAAAGSKIVWARDFDEVTQSGLMDRIGV